MIATDRAHLHVAAATHPGMSGKNNEDRYAVSAYRLENSAATPALLAIVADGIGGHRAGEVAAEIAVETISRIVAESNGATPPQTLQEAIIQAGRLIHSEAEAHPEQKGMGSTCACAWIIGNQLYTATVGDSRIYLVRQNSIRQLSVDHTWVQEAIEQGVLLPEQARSHPNAHVIRRYLGSRSGVVPDLRLNLYPGEDIARSAANQGTLLYPGDMLLLCSDGLTDLVEDSEILAALQTRSPEGALEELVEAANRRGGHDNITIVALRTMEPDQPTIPIPLRKPVSLPARPTRRYLGLALAAGAGFFGLVLLVAAVFGLAWLLGSRPGPEVTLSPVPMQRSTLFPESPATALPAGGEAVTPPAVQQLLPGTPTPGDQTPLPEDSPAVTLTSWPTNTPRP